MFAWMNNGGSNMEEGDEEEDEERGTETTVTAWGRGRAATFYAFSYYLPRG